MTGRQVVMSPRLLVTGSRGWSDLDGMVAALVDAWRDLGKPTRPVLVHGACRGADTMADQLWRLWRWPTDPHPADWSRFGDLAGPRRNAVMVAAGADLCLAFPTPGSRGTWDCVRRAQTAGIPVRVHQPHRRLGGSVTNNPRPRQPVADCEMTGYVVSHGPGWNPQASNPTSAASALWRRIHRAHHSGE